MTTDRKQVEYDYLLKFYLQLCQFEPTTSTFIYLKEVERKEINLTLGVLQRKLAEIMPLVQDREFLDANNKKDGER